MRWDSDFFDGASFEREVGFLRKSHLFFLMRFPFEECIGKSLFLKNSKKKGREL
jgi:hypothetical protein